MSHLARTALAVAVDRLRPNSTAAAHRRSRDGGEEAGPRPPLPRIRWYGGALTVLLACVFVSGVVRPEGAAASAGPPSRAVVDITTVKVGDPGNAPAGIVPFQGPPQQGIYQNCDNAPSGCVLVGGVDYPYQTGELEITVGQYVDFLNTVDPAGKNRLNLYSDLMSPSSWPKYGSITRSSGPGVAEGHHYSVAYPQWTNKPFGFANFLRAARFVNSLYNGDVLSRTESSADGFDFVDYRVRLSRETEQGMYDLLGNRRSGATRAHSSGFVVPSQDEWIKAAYFDPTGGGTFSYWQYPTGPFDAPNVSSLNPNNGDVVNSATQPLSSYSLYGPPGAPAGSFPTWCPPQAGQVACDSVNPLGLSPQMYQSLYQGNLSTVGQAQTRSPWGTLDQGGNAVEWTDTITPSPLGPLDPRVWRRLHGGVANAPAYQLWISAIGLQPEDNVFFDNTYPWLGFRIGVIGDLTAR